MSNAYLILKPAFNNLIIRDPITKSPLSENGESKPMIGREGRYWRRRLKDGSVIIVSQRVYNKSKKEDDK